MKIHSVVPGFVKNVVLMGTAFVAFAGTAQAQSQGVVTGARGDSTVAVYKSPTDAQPAGTVPGNGFPWPIEDVKGDFLLVTVGGKRIWVDAMDVTANRASSNRCSQGQLVADIAGQPGAANSRCK